MLTIRLLFICALVAGIRPLVAQTDPLVVSPFYPYSLATPAHSWEMGLHTGVPLALSDIDLGPGIGVGMHIRKALDFVFSLRSELLFAKMTNEDDNDGSTETIWQSGTFEIIASLNNLVWSNRKYRRFNFYGLTSAGINRFRVDVLNVISPDIAPKDYSLQTHFGLGMGLSFRLSDRYNVGLETKAWMLFGKHDDRLDGVDRQQGDVLAYPSLRLNINLGNRDKKTEPLYWINPIGMLLHDATEMKKHPGLDLTDTDGDGIIDLLDRDNATPPGVKVDIRGIALDTDNDGIPDHEDIKPYLPSNAQGLLLGGPFPSESANVYLNGGVPAEINYTENTPSPTSPEHPNQVGNMDPMTANLANWFLPPIHFDIDSDKIRTVDINSLAHIASIMYKDTSICLVVTGFTEKTASKGYNKLLAYKRSCAAINHLVEIHHLPRRRFVLQYHHNDHSLVPSAGNNLMNRRADFRVANHHDVNMSEPPVPKPKRVKKTK